MFHNEQSCHYHVSPLINNYSDKYDCIMYMLYYLLSPPDQICMFIMFKKIANQLYRVAPSEWWAEANQDNLLKIHELSNSKMQLLVNYVNCCILSTYNPFQTTSITTPLNNILSLVVC